MKSNKKSWVRKGVFFLFCIYIAALIYFLFFSERYGRRVPLEEYRCNLELFKEIKRFIYYRDTIGTEGVVVNILGNVLAFAPFGFIIPVISSDNRRVLNIGLLTLEFSLSIEITQLLLKVGSFDVDDIFLNTMGGILGFVFYTICLRLAKKK